MDHEEAIKRIKKLIANMNVSIDRGNHSDRQKNNLRIYKYILKVLEGEIHV